MTPCETPLPNGCTLYWKDNGVGGRTYISDEVGGGTVVWDTSLVSPMTLIAALNQDNVLNVQESYRRQEQGVTMTLDEAIKHAEEKACYGGRCARDHAQLAKWLKVLKDKGTT